MFLVNMLKMLLYTKAKSGSNNLTWYLVCKLLIVDVSGFDLVDVNSLIAFKIYNTSERKAVYLK